MKGEWCDYTGHVNPTQKGKRPQHVRCPNCRRRLVPRTMDAEPFGPHFQPYYVIPPHKKRK